MIRESIVKILRTLVTEEEITDDSVMLTPEEFKEYLPYYGWSTKALQYDRRFRGKQMIITGDLDLGRTKLRDLGNITVKGKLDASNTAIFTLDGVTVSGYIWKYNTPLQKRLDYIEFQKKLGAQEEMRERGDWDEDGNLDDLGKCANALFKHLIQTEYEEKEPGDQERLTQLYAEKERREEIEAETEDDENLSELNSINTEIEEIEKRIDVYDLIPEGRRYRLRGFRVATSDGLSKSIYYVGDEYDTEISAVENVKDSFDGAGGIEHAVSDWVIRDNIDEEEIKDYFRDGEYDNVRGNLESYFDEDDFDYSEDVQNKIDEIEEKLENPEGLSQEELDELNEELEDLRDSDKDIPEHMIDDKVEELLNDLVSDPIETIKNYGLDISNFIDEDAVAKQVVRDDGYGNLLNYYDGTEDSVEFEDDTYYIFELDE